MKWPTTLFGCGNAKDSGPNCCVQHTCCGLCVWSSALDKADVKGAENLILTAVVGTLISQVSENRTVDTIADGVVLGAFIKGRRKLVKKYSIEESVIESSLIR